MIRVTRSAEHNPKLHYAWIVAGVTFFVLLITAGIRATPAILMVPLEHEFGWTRAAISGAIALNIALFGIIGPLLLHSLINMVCAELSCARWCCSQPA